MAIRDDLLPGLSTRNVLTTFFGVLAPTAIVILYLALTGVEYPSPHLPGNITLYVMKDYVVIAIIALGTYFFALKGPDIAWSAIGFRRCSVDWIVRAFLLAVILFGLHLAHEVDLKWLGAGSVLLQPELADRTVLRSGSTTLAVLLGFATAILIPVVDEVFLRGIFFAWLRRNLDFFLAAVASSIVFGVIHFEIVRYGPAMVVNIFAAYLYERSGSLWPSIAFHITINVFYLVTII